MLEQEGDDLLLRRVLFGTQPEFRETLVLPHELGGRGLQDPENPLETGPVDRLFQIFDGVELDAALAQDLGRAARLASARVVIDDEVRHRAQKLGRHPAFTKEPLRALVTERAGEQR